MKTKRKKNAVKSNKKHFAFFSSRNVYCVIDVISAVWLVAVTGEKKIHFIDLCSSISKRIQKLDHKWFPDIRQPNNNDKKNNEQHTLPAHIKQNFCFSLCMRWRFLL